MPRNVRLSWTYPTTRQLGGPLDPAEIVETELEFRVTGAPSWTPLAAVSAPGREHEQPGLDFGTYDFRARVLLLDGSLGAWGVLSGAEVLDDSPAGAVQDLALELL